MKIDEQIISIEGKDVAVQIYQGRDGAYRSSQDPMRDFRSDVYSILESGHRLATIDEVLRVRLDSIGKPLEDLMWHHGIISGDTLVRDTTGDVKVLLSDARALSTILEDKTPEYSSFKGTAFSDKELSHYYGFICGPLMGLRHDLSKDEVLQDRLWRLVARDDVLLLDSTYDASLQYDPTQGSISPMRAIISFSPQTSRITPIYVEGVGKSSPGSGIHEADPKWYCSEHLLLAIPDEGRMYDSVQKVQTPVMHAIKKLLHIKG